MVCLMPVHQPYECVFILFLFFCGVLFFYILWLEQLRRDAFLLFHCFPSSHMFFSSYFPQALQVISHSFSTSFVSEQTDLGLAEAQTLEK